MQNELLNKIIEKLPKEKEVLTGIGGWQTNLQYNLAREEFISSLPQVMEVIKGEIEKVELKVYDKRINNDVIRFYTDAMEETKRIIITLLSGEDK